MTDTRHKTTIEIGVDDRQVIGLSKSMERAFDPRLLENFERSLDRIAQKMEKMGSRAGGPSGPATGLGAPAQGTAGQVGSSSNDIVSAINSLRDELKKTNEDTRKARAQGGSSAGGGMLSSMLQFHLLQQALAMGPGLIGGSATSSALGAIPYIGGTLGAAAQTAVRLHSEFAQQQMAQAAVFGQTGIGGGMGRLVGMGVSQYGLAPGMVPSLVGQFAGQSSLTGGQLAGAFPTQLALSQLLGVNNAGSFIGAARTAGGEVGDPSAMLEEAVGQGLAAGIRETRLDQHIGGLASFLEDARSRGINLSPESVIGLFSAFSGSGRSFQGEAGANFATSFGQGFGRAGRGRGFAQGLALRAAGFGSTHTYQQALERMEARDPAAMAAFVQSIQGMTGDVDTGAFLIRSAMEGLGVDMSSVQSRELFENGMGTDMGFNREAAQSALADRRRAAGGVFSAGSFQGGLALQRQAIGANLGDQAARIQRLDLQVMGAGLQALTPVMNALIGTLERLTTAFVQGGFGGLMLQAGGELISGLGDMMSRPLAEIVRMVAGPEAAQRYLEDMGAGIETLRDPSRSMVGEVAEAVQNNSRNRTLQRLQEAEAQGSRQLSALRRELGTPEAMAGRVVQFPGQSERGARNSANAWRQAGGLPPLGLDAPIVAAEHLEAAAGALRQMGAPPGDVTVE